MNNDVSDPIKPTSQTSYFRLMIACITFGPLVLMTWLWLADRFLQPDSAQMFKAILNGAWLLLTGSSGLATLKGGLLRTQAKVDYQNATAATAAASGNPATDPAETRQPLPDALSIQHGLTSPEPLPPFGSDAA